MRGFLVLAGALLMAACSDDATTAPAPTETASAGRAKASKKAEEEAPVTAASCIERAKGTGMRAEIARPCHEQACEAGDARACEILKNYDGFAAGRQAESDEDNPEAEAPGDSDQSDF